MEPILQYKNLTKVFPGKVALSGANLEIGRGRIVGLLGPNGSGKSTLVKMCNGFLTPMSGEPFIDGNTPGIETKRIVSYLPERAYLNDWMTVRDLVDFFDDSYADFDKARAYGMFQRLDTKGDARLKTMSKGTKERVQLILVMSRDASLYLLDEPIGGVDPAARDYILNTITSSYSENATVMISTHLISGVERILDSIIFIDQGSIALASSVEEIREKNNKSVNELFREMF